MKIPDSEIDTVEPFGILDGTPVNLVVTRGGLNLATHTDSKGKESVLGAASHRAILQYTVEQRYPRYQPPMIKSETQKISAESHSHFLNNDLRKTGHDIYSIQNGNNVDFFVTKLNIKVGSVSSSFENGKLLIKSFDLPAELSNGMSSAISEKALSQGVKKVEWK